jgi:hypothetical protein
MRRNIYCRPTPRFAWTESRHCSRPINVELYCFSMTRPEFMATLPVAPVRQAYAVSPDGQRFLFNAPLEMALPPLMIVQNWTAVLQK